MEETNEKRKPSFREIKRALIFIASFTPLVTSILVGMSPDGLLIGWQGSNIIYGSDAVILWYYSSMIPFMASNNGLLGLMRILTVPAFVYQIYYLVHSRNKKRVLVVLGVMIILLIVGGVVADPISRARRANKDIEPYVMEYLTEKYGSDAVADMKIVIEKRDVGRFSADHSFKKYIYSVTGPMFKESLMITYTNEWHAAEEGKEAYTTQEVEES
ncbi:MAG: hypothetical protein IKS10_07035 [Lachnospiraceae bacterium]|nr:hypothetical protein [Lachnospiraceae bacterium]